MTRIVHHRNNPHAPAPRSVAMVRVGNDDYPMVSKPNCTTCQSEHRFFIEREVLKGRGYAAVARMAADLENHGELGCPSAESIRGHVRNQHLPQPAATRRKIIERRAEQIGVQIVGEDDIVDYVAVNELVIQRGFERMLEGAIEPDMGDLLAALKNQHSFEATSEQGFDAEAYNQAMMVYFTTVQRYMAPDAFEAMMADLNRNPILKALRERADSSTQEEPETIPGELVDATAEMK